MSDKIKLDGSELWELVYGATQGGGNQITEEQYAAIANDINTVFIAPKDAEIAKLREALEAADEWIGILRGSCGDVVLDSFDDRDPSAIESETRAKIRAALKEQADA